MTLGFVARAIVQVLAAHALVSTLVALSSSLAWNRIASSASMPASALSRRLFHLRMAPAAAAAVVAWGGILIAFGFWEPIGRTEPVGPLALALAAAGAALAISSLWRLATALQETDRIHRSLVDADARAPLPVSPLPAFVIDSRFPIVALVGVFVSRLFVARTVVDACDEGELRAVMAHEQAHAAARDNLKRLLDRQRARRAGVAADRHAHAARLGRHSGTGRRRDRRQAQH